jgi:hypothetical protein
MVMKDILANPYYSALVILISQIIFIYLRTINVIYTSERRLWPTIISGNGIGLAWLVSMSIGANSIMHGEPLPIAAFLVGGTVGSYLGIKKETKKKDGHKDKNND